MCRSASSVKSGRVASGTSGSYFFLRFLRRWPAVSRRRGRGGRLEHRLPAGSLLLAHARGARPRHGLAGRPGRRDAARPAPGDQEADRQSQNERMMPCWSSGRTNVAPTIMPRMPMKRVSRPTRIACRPTSTNAKPRLSEPSSWRTVPTTIGPLLIASTASAFVPSAARLPALDDAHDADDRRADAVGDRADRGDDQRDLPKRSAARLRGLEEEGEHDEDQQRPRRREQRADRQGRVVADVVEL